MSERLSSTMPAAGIRAESIFSDLPLIMTLKHLKLIATLTPVVALIALEAARYWPWPLADDPFFALLDPTVGSQKLTIASSASCCVT